MRILYVVYSKKYDRIMSSPSNAFSTISGAKTAMTFQFSGRGNCSNEGTKEDYKIMEIEIR
jgi:hypothetical protein